MLMHRTPRALVLSLLLAISLAACSQEDLDLSVIGSPDSSSLEVGMNTCNANPQVEAQETSSEVRLTVNVDDTNVEDGNDCRDSVDVELGEELGDRTVIDGATGDELPVSSGG